MELHQSKTSASNKLEEIFKSCLDEVKRERTLKTTVSASVSGENFGFQTARRHEERIIKENTRRTRAEMLQQPGIRTNLSTVTTESF